MNSQQLTFLIARKRYSKCANKLEAKIKEHGLSETLSEQIIGIGVAADWVRRAAEMEDISYVGEQLNNSKRKASFVEVLRYGFAWFGLNAVFARPALLDFVGAPANSGEFEQFLVLFHATPLPDAATQTADLVELLTAQVESRLPHIPIGTSVSTLRALQTKYLSHIRPIRGRTAKAVAGAAVSGNVASLDLATLLYAFRNWSVHGNALDGCFGSRPGFLKYVGILQQVLADVHVATATKLDARI